MKPILEIQQISKKFKIQHEKQGYLSLRDSISNIFTSKTSKEDFWALKDVSFDVYPGDSIGIIGRNGAGKSTLLKILSKITPPTSGRILSRGRIASLLEVGTGFHPELTGRENIYLNGSILGLKKQEINRQFDAIVDFSGVEKFLDTPLKHYSSGMQLRLAFAVAAHLEPEILIIDEVLAVGDAEFQKKCIGKMGEVSKSGRTILFVSHNMGYLQQICNKAVLLSSGSVSMVDDVSKVISAYLSNSSQNVCNIDFSSYNNRSGNGTVRFQWVKITNSNGQLCNEFSIGEDITIIFSIKKIRPIDIVKIAVELKTSEGIPISNMIDIDSGFQIYKMGDEEVISVILKDVRFYPDKYLLGLYIGDITSSVQFDWIQDCISVNIMDGGKLTTRVLPRNAGLLFLTPEWNRQVN